MANKAKKIPHIKPINNFAMLFVLSIFQLITGFEAASVHEDFSTKAILSTLVLIALEWVYVTLLYFTVHRRNFELEFIAFFLSGVGLTVIGSVNPDACFKQLIILAVSVIAYTVFTFVLGDVDLCMKLRMPVAIAGMLLLAVNLIFGTEKYGARNWISIGSFTMQPSEFVKVAFIFVGAATLEKIQTSKNIIRFIIFSIVCVGALILMRDFGAALIFFITFLIIAFMNSGDIKTAGLAVAAAGLGGAIVIKYKPCNRPLFRLSSHLGGYLRQRLSANSYFNRYRIRRAFGPWNRERKHTQIF
mgnify:CR=1 FL=1